MRRPVLAVLAPASLLLACSLAAADSPRSAPVLLVTLGASEAAARIEITGVGEVHARQISGTNDRSLEVELVDGSGRRIGSVASSRLEKASGAVPIRILDASGRHVEPRRTSAGAGGRIPQEPTSTLGWNEANGTSWTFAVYDDAVLELTGSGGAGSAAAAPGTTSSVDRPALGFGLMAGWPNPFQQATTLRFSLPERGHAAVSIFDIAGRRVATVLDEPRGAGLHSVEYNGGSLALGLYFVRLSYRNGDGTITRTASTPIVRVH